MPSRNFQIQSPTSSVESEFEQIIQDTVEYDDFDFGNGSTSTYEVRRFLKPCIKYPEPKKKKGSRGQRHTIKKSVIFADQLVEVKCYCKPTIKNPCMDFISPEKRQERRRLSALRARVIRKSSIKTHNFLIRNPLGVPNNPYFRDCQKTKRQLISEVLTLIKEVKGYLKYVPTIFQEIHPFDNHIVTYMNSVGRLANDPARPPINPSSKNPNAFRAFTLHEIPWELELKLWSYRKLKIKEFYCKELASQGIINIDFLHMGEYFSKNYHKGKHKRFVENPFQYFTKDVLLNEDLESVREDWYNISEKAPSPVLSPTDFLLPQTDDIVTIFGDELHPNSQIPTLAPEAFVEIDLTDSQDIVGIFEFD